MAHKKLEVNPSVFLGLVKAIQVAKTNGGSIDKAAINAVASEIEKLCPNAQEKIACDLPKLYVTALQEFAVRNNKRARVPEPFFVFCEMRALARRVRRAGSPISSDARDSLERDCNSLYDRLQNAELEIRRAA